VKFGWRVSGDCELPWQKSSSKSALSALLLWAAFASPGSGHLIFCGASFLLLSHLIFPVCAPAEHQYLRQGGCFWFASLRAGGWGMNKEASKQGLYRRWLAAGRCTPKNTASHTNARHWGAREMMLRQRCSWYTYKRVYIYMVHGCNVRSLLLLKSNTINILMTNALIEELLRIRTVKQ
jgi:hypothetical protein